MFLPICQYGVFDSLGLEDDLSREPQLLVAFWKNATKDDLGTRS